LLTIRSGVSLDGRNNRPRQLTTAYHVSCYNGAMRAATDNVHEENTHQRQRLRRPAGSNYMTGPRANSMKQISVGV
jgi:hypothetical protein